MRIAIAIAAGIGLCLMDSADSHAQCAFSSDALSTTVLTADSSGWIYKIDIDATKTPIDILGTAEQAYI